MNQPFTQLLSAHAINLGGLGFDSRAGQIGTVSPAVRYRCDVSSELCSTGAKPRKAAEMGPATRFTLRRNITSIIEAFIFFLVL